MHFEVVNVTHVVGSFYEILVIVASYIFTRSRHNVSHTFATSLYDFHNMRSDRNVVASLPTTYISADYTAKDTEFIIALSITLALFLIEFGGFVGGISMFSHTQSLFSIAAHAGASVALAFFIFDTWSSTLYWWIFAFCSALPAVTEIGVLFRVLVLKKNL